MVVIFNISKQFLLPLSNGYFESEYKMAAFPGEFSIYIKKYAFTIDVRIGTIIGPCGFVLPDQNHARRL